MRSGRHGNDSPVFTAPPTASGTEASSSLSQPISTGSAYSTQVPLTDDDEVRSTAKAIDGRGGTRQRRCAGVGPPAERKFREAANGKKGSLAHPSFIRRCLSQLRRNGVCIAKDADDNGERDDRTVCQCPRAMGTVSRCSKGGRSSEICQDPFRERRRARFMASSASLASRSS